MLGAFDMCCAHSYMSDALVSCFKVTKPFWRTAFNDVVRSCNRLVEAPTLIHVMLSYIMHIL